MDSIFATKRTDSIEAKLKRAIAGEPLPSAAPSFAYAFWQAAGMWAQVAMDVDSRRESRLRYSYKEFIRAMPNYRVITARKPDTWCAFCHDPVEIGQRILYQTEPSFRIVHADVETCLHSKFLAADGAHRSNAIALAFDSYRKTYGDDAK